MSINYLSSSGDYTVVSQCGSAGGAMFDPLSKPSIYPWPDSIPTYAHCFKLAAPPIIISDLYMSTDQAIAHVNMVFRVNGSQPPLPTNINLEGEWS